ncbi:MAG: flagellar basal-body rod protein FlgF [Acidobacteriota bacterium]|nr:flagellar basal-body rod protein FlgF [Acidobacteriota bacterium]
MDSGLYAAYTGLMARTQALDTTANNLSNVSTNGYRAQRDFFAHFMPLDSNTPAESQVGDAVNGFSVLGGNTLDLSQGQLVSTGNPLDVALRGTGFFAVKTPGGVRYTRNGSFELSNRGQLQTMAGYPVLDAALKPIVLPAGEITISRSGQISVQTGDGNGIAGQLGVFDFGNPAALQAEGADLVSAGAEAKRTASAAETIQGSIEQSNQDAIHGSMELVLEQRQAEMMQKALSVFNNDLDKTASEELSRV